MEYRVGIVFGLKEGKPVIYKVYPIEKEYAEKFKIPHKVVYVLAIRDGKINIIKRAENNKTYPNLYSIPAGHTNVLEKDGDLVCESSFEAAKRELKEETNLETSYWIPAFLKDKLIYNKSTGHFGQVYISFINNDVKPRYNKEINPKESGFETPEELLKKLEKDNFTPSSRKILEEFLKEYSTTEALKELYESNIQS